MPFFPDLDNQEKLLLISGGFALLFTLSYTINFFKVSLGFINYTDTGALSLFFCYLNMTLWYCYSVLIEHEYLLECYWYSSWIIFILINLYLSYAYYFDKFDTFLNFLIILIIHSTLYKIFVQIYDDELKTLRFCGYTQTIHLISLLEWTYRAIITKNIRNLNVYVGITLIFYSCSLIIYSEDYHNYFILFPSFGGVCVGLLYISGWFYLSQVYPEGIEFKGVPNLEIEDKSENPKNSKKNFDEERNLYKNNNI